jgi:hypothetical protein
MARDDILSRDYVAPSRPIIQDTRKSEMWEKLLADSMDLLKMQTLSSQEIAREKRAESTAERTAVRSLEDAESLIRTEATLKEDSATNKFSREKAGNVADDLAGDLGIIYQLDDLNTRVLELKALRLNTKYADHYEDLDRRIILTEQNAKKMQRSSEQFDLVSSDIASLYFQTQAGLPPSQENYTAIETKIMQKDVAGKFTHSSADRKALRRNLDRVLETVASGKGGIEDIISAAKGIIAGGDAITNLEVLKKGAKTDEEKKRYDDQIDQIKQSQDALGNSIDTINLVAIGKGGVTDPHKAFQNAINNKIAQNPTLSKEEAMTELDNEMMALDIDDEQLAEKIMTHYSATFGVSLDALKKERTIQRKAKPKDIPQPQAVVGPTTRWGTAAAEFAARPPDPEVPETIAMTAEIQREMERFDVETQAKADQITNPDEKSDWLEKRASARKTKERVLTDVSQAREAQADIPSGTYTVQGKEIRVEPTTSFGRVTGLSIYPSNNFALSDVLNIPKTNAGKKVRITKKRDEELFNQIVAMLLASR